MPQKNCHQEAEPQGAVPEVRDASKNTNDCETSVLNMSDEEKDRLLLGIDNLKRELDEARAKVALYQKKLDNMSLSAAAVTGYMMKNVRSTQVCIGRSFTARSSFWNEIIYENTH